MAGYRFSTFSQAHGREFEDAFVEECISSYRGDFTITTGTELDKCQGTDGILYGIPVDFTMHYNGKDHMTDLDSETSIFVRKQEIKIQYGIRYGNSYKGFSKFKKPVLVVGVKTDLAWAVWEDAIREAIHKNIQSIMDTGMDAYLDAIPD